MDLSHSVFLKRCLNASNSEWILTSSFLNFWLSVLLKGCFLILWFYLKTFKNLYCHGSVFQSNYFPYFHQQRLFFCWSSSNCWSQSWLLSCFIYVSFKSLRSWSIGLTHFLSESFVSLCGLLILEGTKCLEHTTLDIVTRKPYLKLFY